MIFPWKWYVKIKCISFGIIIQIIKPIIYDIKSAFCNFVNDEKYVLNIILPETKGIKNNIKKPKICVIHKHIIKPNIFNLKCDIPIE